MIYCKLPDNTIIYFDDQVQLLDYLLENFNNGIPRPEVNIDGIFLTVQEINAMIIEYDSPDKRIEETFAPPEEII